LRTARAGYTLLEITLVVALMAMLAALAVPTLEGMWGDSKVNAAGDAFRAALVAARSHAIDEGQAYSVAVIPGTSRYRYAPAAAAFWNGASDPGASSSLPSTIEEGELPGGILFATEDGSDSGGGWVTQATFYPDGTAADDTRVTFNPAGGGRSLVLTVRALTGGVSVGPPDAESVQP
jgi:prepilin-type N-terminal cleavage/methylation domain-containing protein